VLDLMLPEIGGLEVCKMLRSGDGRRSHHHADRAGGGDRSRARPRVGRG
jgi:CheY-like chemotaxis protein